MQKQSAKKELDNQTKFIPIIAWDGWVEEIEGDSFFARLINTEDETKIPREFAEFSINELSTSDREHLQLGSIIHWVIGTEIFPSGQKKDHVSRVNLQLEPKITKEDLI